MAVPNILKPIQIALFVAAGVATIAITFKAANTPTNTRSQAAGLYPSPQPTRYQTPKPTRTPTRTQLKTMPNPTGFRDLIKVP